MKNKISLKGLKVDWITILSMIFIFSIGVTFLNSATSMNDSSTQFDSQIIKFGIGLVLMFVVANINPMLIKKSTPNFYLVVMIMLAAVPFFGKNILGAKRWLDLYFIQIQPSELVKIAVPAMIAFIVSKIGSLDNMRKLFLTSIFVVVPVALILNQPDLGTSILILASSATVIFCSGVTTRFLLTSFFATIIGGFLSFKYILKDYQLNRIKTLFNPELDPMGSGYHVIQSKIAIGSGGFSGKGMQEGTQSQLSFIPEQSTDFILAVFLEESGFIGFIALTIGFSILIGRMFYMTYKMQDVYAKLLSISITTSIFIYCFVNIGMVIGILPVVGVPLPFFSYGGSSMLTTMLCIGIVINFYKNRRMYQKKTIKDYD